MNCNDVQGYDFLTSFACGVDANGNCLYAAADGSCTTNQYCGSALVTAYYCDGSCGFDDGIYYGYNTDALGTTCGPANCFDSSGAPCGRDSAGNCTYPDSCHDCSGNCICANDDCGNCGGSCNGCDHGICGCFDGDGCGCGNFANYDFLGDTCGPANCYDSAACGRDANGYCQYNNCDGSCTSSSSNPYCCPIESDVRNGITYYCAGSYQTGTLSARSASLNIGPLIGLPPFIPL
jgi:hypothetical protein